MRRLAWLAPLALLTSACTDGGYPSSDVEMIVVGVVVLGVLALVGFIVWCATR